ncbi:membrane protein [Salmonella enterica subsp. enterica serovar Choleraesuis]|nr:membrane protein [Salmonella enterica subsp. enterica serovar Choleraesuis]
MKHPLETLVTAAATLLLAMLSCLLLPAPRLSPEQIAWLTETLGISTAELYTLVLCLWFIVLGVIEYLIIRYVWRRWFAI